MWSRSTVRHLTRRCCCCCLCSVQPKATGLRWSGAMKSIKEQQLISITKAFKSFGNSVKTVVWPHLLPMVIFVPWILDPEGPTLPLLKCTIVTTWGKQTDILTHSSTGVDLRSHSPMTLITQRWCQPGVYPTCNALPVIPPVITQDFTWMFQGFNPFTS